MERVRIGCSGWSYDDWRGGFYPKGCRRGHPSWFAAPVRELLVEHGASSAIGDDKRRPLPNAAPVGRLAYLRLHYSHRGRGGNYSRAELDV
jgi:uncharacterized protein YecE (DUF72 family)